MSVFNIRPPKVMYQIGNLEGKSDRKEGEREANMCQNGAKRSPEVRQVRHWNSTSCAHGHEADSATKSLCGLLGERFPKSAILARELRKKLTGDIICG